MGAVAKRFGVSLGELSNLNDLPERGRLTPGMFVALPAAPRGSRSDTRSPSPRKPRGVAPQGPQATYTPAGPRRNTPRRPVPIRPVPRLWRRRPRDRPKAAQNRPSSGGAPAELFLSGDVPPGPTAALLLTPEAEGPLSEELGGERLASLGTRASSSGRSRGQINVVIGFGAAGMGRRNDGLDIGAPEGSEVRAAAVGEVVYAGDQVPGFGNLVLIKHAGELGKRLRPFGQRQRAHARYRLSGRTGGHRQARREASTQPPVAFRTSLRVKRQPTRQNPWIP